MSANIPKFDSSEIIHQQVAFRGHNHTSEYHDFECIFYIFPFVVAYFKRVHKLSVSGSFEVIIY